MAGKRKEPDEQWWARMEARYADEPDYLENLRTIAARTGVADLRRNEPLARRYWGLHRWSEAMKTDPAFPGGCELHSRWLLEQEALRRGVPVERLYGSFFHGELFDRAFFDDLLSDEEFEAARARGLPLEAERLHHTLEALRRGGLAR